MKQAINWTVMRLFGAQPFAPKRKPLQPNPKVYTVEPPERADFNGTIHASILAHRSQRSQPQA